MRLAIIALALMPAAAMAQETTITIPPAAPVAQTQTCPQGFVWDADAGNCAVTTQSARPTDMLGEPAGCGHSAAREVTS